MRTFIKELSFAIREKIRCIVTLVTFNLSTDKIFLLLLIGLDIQGLLLSRFSLDYLTEMFLKLTTLSALEHA